MPPVPYRQRFLPKLTRTVNGLEGAVRTRVFTAVCRYGTARSPSSHPAPGPGQWS